MSKRLICLIVSALMVVSVMVAAPTRAEAATKPVLKTTEMKVSRKKATKGQTITYTFKITNCKSAELSLYNTSAGWQMFQVPLTKKGSTFTAKVKVTNAFDPGTLKVMGVHTYYGSNWNHLAFVAPDYYMKGDKKTNFKTLNVKITGTKGDHTPPAINASSFKISKTKVKQHDAVKVSVKVTDKMAGVKSLLLGVRTPSGFSTSYLLDNVRYKNGVMTGTFYADQKGVYKIRSIEVEDKVGNLGCVLDTRFKKDKAMYESVKMASLKKWDITVK